MATSEEHSEGENSEYKLFGGNNPTDGQDKDRPQKKINLANTKAEVVAKLPVKVLLQGPTGTGKSRLARYIATVSKRAEKPIGEKVWKGLQREPIKDMLAWAGGCHCSNAQKEIADKGAFSKRVKDAEWKECRSTIREINLAALSSEMIASELFGYVAGAYTDASKHGYPGLFIQANGGTLFIDEIADCPMDIQAKLLTVIQPREGTDESIVCPCYIRPAGQDEEVAVDVRLIFATNKDLRKEVAAHRFREDLYFRIKEYCIDLPPMHELDDTSGDMPDLIVNKDTKKTERHCGRRWYLNQCIDSILNDVNERFSGCCSDNGKEGFVLTDQAWFRLITYDYPGNYRELQAILNRAWINAYANKRLDRPVQEIDAEDLELRDDIAEDDVTEDELIRGSDQDYKEEIKYALKEIYDAGWCNHDDMKSLVDAGLHFTVKPDQRKNRGQGRGGAGNSRVFDPVAIRNLGYFIHVIKGWGINEKGKRLEMLDCSSRVMGGSAQTIRCLLVKFGLTYEDARDVLLRRFGLLKGGC